MRYELRISPQHSLVKLSGRPLIDMVDAWGGCWGYVLDPDATVNRAQALERKGIWEKTTWAVETGALNEHTQDIDFFIDELERLSAAIGPNLKYVDVDETMHKIRHRALLDWTAEDTAEAVAPFYKAARDLGIQPRPIEPFPGSSWALTTRPFLTALHNRFPFKRFTLDLDWEAIDREAPRKRWHHYLFGGYDRGDYDRIVVLTLVDIERWCIHHNVDLALIVGSPYNNDFGEMSHESFIQSALDNVARVRRCGVKPDVLVFQSWEPRPSKKNRRFPDFRTWESLVERTTRLIRS